MKTLKDERTNESGRIDGQIGPHAVQDKAELLSKQPQLMTDQSRNILRLPALLRLLFFTHNLHLQSSKKTLSARIMDYNS